MVTLESAKVINITVSVICSAPLNVLQIYTNIQKIPNTVCGWIYNDINNYK